jgi:RNA polymerase sigma-70 factor (ECF subfamily)
MTVNGRPEMRAGLAEHLARLWRYGLILSGNRDAAVDLVEATCARALERPDEFAAGTPLDRRLFSMLRSIWLAVRDGRQADGPGDAPRSMFLEGAAIGQTHALLRQVLREVEMLPQPEQETLFLVYAEGMTYRETAEILGVPEATVLSRLVTARESLGRLRERRRARPSSPGVAAASPAPRPLSVNRGPVHSNEDGPT